MDTEGNNLNGQIKSITQTVFDANDRYGSVCILKHIPNSSHYASSFESGIYDIVGDVNYIKKWNEDGSIAQVVKNIIHPHINTYETYTYENGNLIRKIITKDLWPEGINHVTYASTVEPEKQYKYNEAGLLCEIKTKNANPSQNGLVVFEYDDKNRTSRQLFYNEEGLLSWRYEYTYESDGVSYTLTEFTRHGKKNSLHNYIYKNGMLADYSHRALNSGKSFIISAEKYDEKGRLIFKFFTSSSNVDGVIYDKNNNITKYNCNKDWQVLETKEFTYLLDYKYNWIQRIHYRNGIPFALTKRDIIYYDEK